MTKDLRLNARIDADLQRKLREMSDTLGINQSAVLTVAINRLHQQEMRTMTAQTQTTMFDTIQEAYDAGFTRAVKGGNVKDTSGPNEFGYAFTRYDDDGNAIAEAVPVWLCTERNKMGREGCVVMMFPPRKTSQQDA